MRIEEYINWEELWTKEISHQITDLEDYEPTLNNVDYEQVKNFMSARRTSMFEQECYLDKTDLVFCFTDDIDDEAVSLWITVGEDGLISRVSLES